MSSKGNVEPETKSERTEKERASPRRTHYALLPLSNLFTHTHTHTAHFPVRAVWTILEEEISADVDSSLWDIIPRASSLVWIWVRNADKSDLFVKLDLYCSQVIRLDLYVKTSQTYLHVPSCCGNNVCDVGTVYHTVQQEVWGHPRDTDWWGRVCIYVSISEAGDNLSLLSSWDQNVKI